MTSRCSFPLTVVTISFPFNAVIKQLLDSVFGDVQNNQGLVKADNLTETLITMDITKNESNNCL